MILAVLVLLAVPKFETSTITASRSTIYPLETIEYTVTVRNSGDSTPSYLRVANAIPASAMFVSASPDWKFIEADRELSWLGTLPPGASKVLKHTLVTRPESSGLTLANRAAIHYDGAYWAVDRDLEIDTPPTGGGITEAGQVVLGYVAVAAMIMLAVRRQSRMRRTAVWLIVLSTGFLLIFGHMAWRDSRMRTEFVETQCTVVDSMARYMEARQTGGAGKPIFAVRYGDMVSIGYGREPLSRGAKAKCWYDPEEPTKVVLSRALDGGYVFALIPFGTLAFGIALMRRESRPSP